MRTILVLTIACLMFWGCSSSESQSNSDPATREAIDKDRYIVRLTPRAAERLDIQTTTVQAGEGEQRLIPYSAVVYMPDGSSWTYVKSTGLEFVRGSINVEAVRGDTAILSEGPAPGTEVVTVGVSELWGVEGGVGE